MSTIALEGVGATIAFSISSSFTGDLISITLPEESVEALDTTHLGTAAVKSSKAAKLAQLSDISAEFDHVPGAPRMVSVQQSVTIAWPTLAGQVTPYKRVYPGFVMNQGGEEMKTETLMRTKITFHPTGQYTEVAAT